MSLKRRKVLSNLLMTSLAAPLIGSTLMEETSTLPRPHKKSPISKPLSILILGGTSFLGPHQIATALERGHTISIFTRGKTKPTVHQSLFTEVEHLVGDRENNLEALKNRDWDVVIDNSGHRVHWTKQTAELLKDRVGMYCYTSSTGVYYPYLGKDIMEDTPLVKEVPENINDYQQLEYGYGVMKTLSEIEVLNSFGQDRSIIVRPTYMMGPGDRTDRFIYWPVRMSRGGAVLVPGFPNDPVQYVDVRDVAWYMIHLIEQETVGTSNAVGPAGPTTMQAFVHGVHAAFNAPATYVQIDDYDFLHEAGIDYIVPWIMPTGENAGSALVNNQKGIDQGLRFMPLAESVRDLYEWWQSPVVAKERKEELVNRDKSVMRRESEILRQWAEYRKSK